MATLVELEAAIRRAFVVSVHECAKWRLSSDVRLSFSHQRISHGNGRGGIGGLAYEQGTADVTPHYSGHPQGSMGRQISDWKLDGSARPELRSGKRE